MPSTLPWMAFVLFPRNYRSLNPIPSRMIFQSRRGQDLQNAEVACMSFSLAVVHTLALLKNVTIGAVPALGWISMLPCINNAEGIYTLEHHYYGSLCCLLHWLLRNHSDECSRNAEKDCPQVSHSLAACEWVPDFSSPKLIEIIPFSQNNSVTLLLFKPALPVFSTGLTMWWWLGCYDVQHRMKAC